MTKNTTKDLTKRVIKHVLENYTVGDRLEKHDIANEMGVSFKQLKYPFDMFVLYKFVDSRKGRHGAVYTYIDDLVFNFSDRPKKKQKVYRSRYKSSTDINNLFDNFIFGMTI